MSVVDEYVVDGVAILTDLYHLQTKALLYESEFIVLAEHQFLAMLYVDGVLLATLIVVNHVVAVVVENDAVLQHLSN